MESESENNPEKRSEEECDFSYDTLKDLFEQPNWREIVEKKYAESIYIPDKEGDRVGFYEVKINRTIPEKKELLADPLYGDERKKNKCRRIEISYYFAGR